MRARWLLIAPFAIVGMALFAALGGWIVQSLWNWLLPPLFGWSALTFWQALGMLILCRLLFGGVGLGGGSRRSMNSEARERFRQRMRERFGFRSSAEGPGGAHTP